MKITGTIPDSDIMTASDQQLVDDLFVDNHDNWLLYKYYYSAGNWNPTPPPSGALAALAIRTRR